ncbi:uncharacterized protein LOC119305793 [Triticum dicoccoides]|uniref:uncharacterized protein LOC119305793 n=1 Tax=Triticum dicoccoides TaxID=85692 RepID=UPI0018905D5E|nr:uncharacterized protein LOC119305793 [Triticum dicoccoides]XP_037438118.1 uncharacterized protein LOC119305793 [Triticum dicoccoides]
MPAAGPRGGHSSFATASSTLYAAYGAEPRRPPRLELGRVVTEFDSALTIDSHLVAVPVTRPSPMAPARPRHEDLGCGRPVSLLPVRGARRTHSSRRSAAAVGLGGEPRWLMAAAAVGRRGRSGGFANPYAGVPPQGRRVYAQGESNGAPSESDRNGHKEPRTVDELMEAYPRCTSFFKLVTVVLCLGLCFLSAKGDPRAALMVTTSKDAAEVYKFLCDVLLILKKLFFP